MPDTIRSEADLLTIFADNSTGDISAQDARDFIVSASVGKRAVAIYVFNSDQSVAVGDGKVGVPIPAELDGFDIVEALAVVQTKCLSGSTDVQIRRRRGGADVDAMSTLITIGDEWHASDGTIDTANDDVAIGDLLYIDLDAVHGTPPKGLSVSIKFERPSS